MSKIIIVVLLLVLAFYIISGYISRKREIKVIKMDVLYTHFEFLFIKHGIVIDSKVRKFIRGVKNIVINYEFTDIEILLHIYRTVDRKKMEATTREINEVMAQLPKEIKEVASEINNLAKDLTRLSLLRPRFIIFGIIPYIGPQLLKNGFKYVAKRVDYYKNKINDEIALSVNSSAGSLNLAA